MSSPKRIQRRRTKGWRMPEGAVYVGRPSKWGNPFRWQEYPTAVWFEGDADHVPATTRRRWSVVDFKSAFAYDIGGLPNYPCADDARRELAGRDLACWCPLSAPCHADVLLEIANSPPS